MKRSGTDQEPDLLALEATDHVLEDGQRLAVGQIGVVDGQQDRTDVAERDDQRVEHRTDLVGIATCRVGRAYQRLDGRRVLQRGIGPVHMCGGRLDESAQDAERGPLLHLAAPGPEDQAAGVGGQAAGGVDQRGAARTPRSFDGDAPAGHVERLAEDGLELCQILAPLKEAGPDQCARASVCGLRR